MRKRRGWAADHNVGGNIYLFIARLPSHVCKTVSIFVSINNIEFTTDFMVLAGKVLRKNDNLRNISFCLLGSLVMLRSNSSF